jgi:hypothetical protein
MHGQVGKRVSQRGLQIDSVLNGQRTGQIQHGGQCLVQICGYLWRGVFQPGQLLVHDEVLRDAVCRGPNGCLHARVLAQPGLQVELFPQAIRQCLQGRALLAPQVTDAHAELIGDLLLAELLHVAIQEEIVDPPGVRPGWLAGLRFESFDGLGQDTLQGGRCIKPVRHVKKGGERALAQAIGIVEVIQRIAQVLHELFAR